MQKLQEILDVVEIVMGFLSSGGANAKKGLKDYIKTTLKMEHKFSSKKASLISFLSCLFFHSVYFWISWKYNFDLPIMLRCVCTQASEHCHLSHVLSLWETLSVELAKRHTMASQVYFEVLYCWFMRASNVINRQIFHFTWHYRSFSFCIHCCPDILEQSKSVFLVKP